MNVLIDLINVVRKCMVLLYELLPQSFLKMTVGQEVQTVLLCVLVCEMNGWLFSNTVQVKHAAEPDRIHLASF